MEPANLNIPSDDDRLKSLLQASSRELPDNGFSDRVVSALPRRRRNVFAQVWPYVFGAVTGTVVARLNGATLPDWSAGKVHFGSALSSLLTFLNDPWLSLAFTLTAVSLLVAYMIVEQARTPHR